jgi:predicted nucleic acid-binding Zn ribbon protein
MDDVEDHRHCKVCGKTVGPEAEYCSKTCRRKREEKVQSSKNYMYFLYGLAALLLILLVFSYVR